MENPFTITSQNVGRVAAVGRGFAVARQFGIRYFVDALRGSKAPESIWETLVGMDTVFLTLNRNYMENYETDFILEAKSRGFSVGLLSNVENDSPEIFDFIEDYPSIDPESEPVDWNSVGLLLGQREPVDSVAKAGADHIIRIPKERIDRLKRYEKELDDSLYDIMNFVPKDGKLIIDSKTSIPFWLAEAFFKNLQAYNTTLVISQDEREIDPSALPEFIAELKESWSKNFPRKVIVLGDSDSASSSLRRAIKGACDYRNTSGDATIVDATPREYGWKWEDAFAEAQNRPNTFIALEDGSVLRKQILELSGELRVISSIGGGLSFGHQSNALFSYLGAKFCVLADGPLNKLIEHLKINHYLDEMSMLNPVDREDRVDSARKTVENLLKQGVSVAEVSRRMGLDRSTIHR